MFGGPDDKGQLALLDAMVFFAIALLISSILAGMAMRPSAQSTGSNEEAYVESALAAFLEASLGRTVMLDLGVPVEIKPLEKVGDCLMAELHGVRDGWNVLDFEPLNSVLESILDSIVARPYLHSLSAYERMDEHAEPLLLLSDVGFASSARCAYASSARLADQDGTCLEVVLQVYPPALPEVPGV